MTMPQLGQMTSQTDREVKGKSRVVAEYALRGVSSSIGVAEYRLTRQLPKGLQQALPSAAGLEQQLRIV